MTRALPLPRLSLVLTTAVLLLGGCTANSGRTSASSAPVMNRPVVEVSAADLYSWGEGAAAQQMEFYEELDRRPIASHDDTIHALLLLSRGWSEGTYEARVAAAKAEGWLDRSFDRPGREAVTVGEVSRMVARIARLNTAGTPGGASGELKRFEILPPRAMDEQGLSGAQLLAVVSGASDIMPAGVVAARRSAPATTYASSVSGSSVERPAPFVAAPAAPAPAPAVITAASVSPAAPTISPAPKASPWVSGRPLGLNSRASR